MKVTDEVHNQLIYLLSISEIHPNYIMRHPTGGYVVSIIKEDEPFGNKAAFALKNDGTIEYAELDHEGQGTIEEVGSISEALEKSYEWLGWRLSEEDSNEG